MDGDYFWSRAKMLVCCCLWWKHNSAEDARLWDSSAIHLQMTSSVQSVSSQLKNRRSQSPKLKQSCNINRNHVWILFRGQISFLKTQIITFRSLSSRTSTDFTGRRRITKPKTYGDSALTSNKDIYMVLVTEGRRTSAGMCMSNTAAMGAWAWQYPSSGLYRV